MAKADEEDDTYVLLIIKTYAALSKALRPIVEEILM